MYEEEIRNALLEMLEEVQLQRKALEKIADLIEKVYSDGLMIMKKF